jgi:acyl carrier protein
MGYVTPEKRQIIEKAIGTITPTYELVSAAENENIVTNNAKPTVSDFSFEEYGLEDMYDQEGGLLVSKSTFESTLALQSIGAKALEEFLASQGTQMEVFKELFKEAGEGAATNNVLRFIEIFQNNSLRAFEAYMGKQQSVLNDAGTFFENNSVIGNVQLPAAVSEIPTVRESAVISEPEPKIAKEPARQTMLSTEKEAPKASDAIMQSQASAEASTAEAITASSDDSLDPVLIMIKIISEKSGYPEELIDADMNIETDLGIDSIKRIEIFAEIDKQIPGELGQDDIEAIAMLHTIREIGDYIKKKM